jgi:hypothetical protein
MNVFIAVGILIITLLFSFGVMTGWSWANQAFEDRSRRQAKRQRELNAERRALRAAKEATTWIQGSRRFRRDEAA